MHALIHVYAYMSFYMHALIHVYAYTFVFTLCTSLNILIVYAMHELRGSLYEAQL